LVQAPKRSCAYCNRTGQQLQLARLDSGVSFFSTTTMGCCGEAAKPDDLQNRSNVVNYPQGTISQQPTGHTALEKPQQWGMQQPVLATPPATYGTPQPQVGQQQNGFNPMTMNGNGTPQWGQSSSPPPAMQQQFTGYSTTAPHSPPPGSSSFGHTAVDSIMRPPSAFNSSSPPPMNNPPLPMLPPGFAQKAADETRMSVSIDFGERFLGMVEINGP
jgi:hypothetical protein